MKKLVFLIPILFCQLSFAQIEKTEYKVLDEFSKSYTPFWEAKSVNIKFKLVSIRNLATSQQVYGIEVVVFSVASELKLTSLSFTNFSKLWSSSSVLAYDILNVGGGIVFISLDEALLAFNFLNEQFTRIIYTKPEFNENYKVTVNKFMEMGFFYDEDRKTWKFFTSVYDGIYEIDINEGIEVIQKFKEFARYKSN